MFDLMGFFITNFDVQTVYNAGWKAAQGWTGLVSGLFLALAIAIRTVQEQLGGAKADYVKAIKDFILYGTLTASLFLFVFLLIEFFNGLYGTLSASSATAQLGRSLNTVFEYWQKTEFEFSLTDLANGFYGAFAFGVFILSYMVLVFVVFAMRIAHAILVSTTAFWASVAIPMAPVNGLNSLKSLKVFVIIAFVWPLFDAFFMYLVASVFVEGLDKAFTANPSDKVTAGQMVFVLFIYSIINIFMVAACIAAAFVAQGVANGTGNVSGLLTSFAGAGIAAGAVAAKYGAEKFNAAGAAAGGGVRDGANKLGAAMHERFGHDTPTANARSGAAKAFEQNPAFAPPTPEAKATPKTNSSPQSSKGAGESSTPEAPASSGSASSGSSNANTTAEQAATGGAASAAPTPSAASQSNATTSNLTSGQAEGGAGSSASHAATDTVAEQAQATGGETSTPTSDNRAPATTASGTSAAGATGAAKSMNLDQESTDIGEEQAAQASSSTSDDEGLATDAQSKKQARRGAIINQQRGKK